MASFTLSGYCLSTITVAILPCCACLIHNPAAFDVGDGGVVRFGQRMPLAFADDLCPSSGIKCYGYCALCPGAVDWHNCGSVPGVWEFGWDCFANNLHALYNTMDNWGPSNPVL